MTKKKWVKLEELRQPGMRRILEAMKLIQEEQPGLIEQASLAVQTKSADVGGGVAQ